VPIAEKVRLMARRKGVISHGLLHLRGREQAVALAVAGGQQPKHRQLGESYWNKADCLSAINLVKGSSNAPVYES
jgi:hypothetical protein